MSDYSQGDGWWQASDGKWYPPHLHPGTPWYSVPPQISPPVATPNGPEPKPVWRRWQFILPMAIGGLVLLSALGSLVEPPEDAEDSGSLGLGEILSGSSSSDLSLIHISEPTRQLASSRMPSSA